MAFIVGCALPYIFYGLLLTPASSLVEPAGFLLLITPGALFITLVVIFFPALISSLYYVPAMLAFTAVFWGLVAMAIVWGWDMYKKWKYQRLDKKT